MQAFDAPMMVVISNLGEPRTATAAACRAGLVTVGACLMLVWIIRRLMSPSVRQEFA